MKQGLVVVLIVGLLYLVYVKMKTPTTLQGIGIVTTGGKSINNPGNIEDPGKTKGYKGQIDSSSIYASFATPEYGYRAMYVILKTYYEQGYTTLLQMINRYSGGENAQNYADYVRQKAQLFSDDMTNVIFDKTVMSLVIAAMAQWEQGQNFDIAYNQVINGVNIA